MMRHWTELMGSIGPAGWTGLAGSARPARAGAATAPPGSGGTRRTGPAPDDDPVCAGLAELAEASLGDGDGFTDWPLVTVGAGLWVEIPGAPRPDAIGYDEFRAVCSA